MSLDARRSHFYFGVQAEAGSYVNPVRVESEVVNLRTKHIPIISRWLEYSADVNADVSTC